MPAVLGKDSTLVCHGTDVAFNPFLGSSLCKIFLGVSLEFLCYFLLVVGVSSLGERFDRFGGCDGAV